MNFRDDHYIEPWKVFVLTFFTLTFYQFYWGYYTWKFIKEETSSPLNPVIRAIALILPVIPITLLFYEVFLITSKFNRRLLFLFSIILSVFVASYYSDYKNLNIEPKLKILLFVAELLICSSVFVLMQKEINKYIKNKNIGNKIEKIEKNNKMIFLIGMTSYFVIAILLMFTELKDNTYVFGTVAIVAVIVYIAIEILDKKGKNYEQ